MHQCQMFILTVDTFIALFILLKDLKFGEKKGSAPECGDSERDLKKDARSWILSLFISSSQTNFDHALSELDKLLEDPQLGNTQKTK